MNRSKLIGYSVLHNGEYSEIVKAIQNEEEIPERVLQIIKNENLESKTITIFDENYPKSLFTLESPPLVLYYKGNPELLKFKEENVGLVGSRMPCDYSIKATKQLCHLFDDMVIISGLAKGIDAVVHETATKTIAVLGCGIDYIYPRCNFDLFKKIEKNGLILSEYPLNTKPLSFHFPFRNRIIAALSEVLYVAECKQSSGTMTTVNKALELGKSVKILPFDIFTAEKYEVYNNELINEGAEIWG